MLIKNSTLGYTSKDAGLQGNFTSIITENMKRNK